MCFFRDRGVSLPLLPWMACMQALQEQKPATKNTHRARFSIFYYIGLEHGDFLLDRDKLVPIYFKTVCSREAASEPTRMYPRRVLE